MTPPLTVEQLTPAAECRELADECSNCTPGSLAQRCETALRQFANLQDHARLGITEEIVDHAEAVFISSISNPETMLSKKAMRAALEAIAPHLAITPPQSTHEFQSANGGEFCDVCNHSVIGHD